MKVIENLPAYDENKLKTLEQNARRLILAGTEKQKADANLLLAAIESERQRRAKQATDRDPDAFDEIWAIIQRKIKPGDNLLNWSVDSAYTGRSFNILTVGRTWITVDGANMTMPREVSKRDFAKIYRIWHEYCSGTFQRTEITTLSQNSTCILSILRKAFPQS
jgi:hypothetical protein